MRLLFDTQCWLWIHGAPERLRAETRRVLTDPNTATYFSAASAWEISIKVALGKLRLPEPAARYVPARCARFGTAVLAVTLDHALRAGGLPTHHRDLFDRMLIAQAQIERLPILTADRRFAAYDVELIEA